MLPESRLYSFIDQKEGFTLHFLEGQKLIQDLAVIHHVVGAGFHYFRDAILSFQPMVSFLKPGEGLGIYLDSEDPYFRLKIEMTEEGQMRTLLLPEEFNQFPQKISGKCRVAKFLPGDREPYTSIISLSEVDFHHVVNKVLRESYQVKSEIFLSSSSDQSLMLMKLPEINIDKIQTHYRMTPAQYWDHIKDQVEELWGRFATEPGEIQAHFEKAGLLYLGSREIKFKCTCSRQRMFDGIRSLIWANGIDHIFRPEEKHIETRCDYCKMNYLLAREEFEG